MKDRICLDVETAAKIDNPTGWRAMKQASVASAWDRTDTMGVGVAVVYEWRTNSFRVYDHSTVYKLRERIQAADEIVGFNVWGFDLPVIYGISRPDWPTSKACHLLTPRVNDLLQRIWLAKRLNPWRWSERHKGWGLGVLALGTLGRGKMACGGDAPLWFQDGRWGLLTTYCIDDVALTRDLSDFADRYGYLLHGTTGERVEPGSWSPLTLPEEWRIA